MRERYERFLLVLAQEHEVTCALWDRKDKHGGVLPARNQKVKVLLQELEVVGLCEDLRNGVRLVVVVISPDLCYSSRCFFLKKTEFYDLPELPRARVCE